MSFADLSSSLCSLCVLCVSVVNECASSYHKNTEDTEVHREDRALEDNNVTLHSRSGMPFSAKNSRKNFSAGLPAFRFILSNPRLIPSIASILSCASRSF